MHCAHGASAARYTRATQWTHHALPRLQGVLSMRGAASAITTCGIRTDSSCAESTGTGASDSGIVRCFTWQTMRLSRCRLEETWWTVLTRDRAACFVRTTPSRAGRTCGAAFRCKTTWFAISTVHTGDLVAEFTSLARQARGLCVIRLSLAWNAVGTNGRTNVLAEVTRLAGELCHRRTAGNSEAGISENARALT
jgi:hypothetical protein